MTEVERYESRVAKLKQTLSELFASMPRPLSRTQAEQEQIYRVKSQLAIDQAWLTYHQGEARKLTEFERMKCGQ